MILISIPLSKKCLTCGKIFLKKTNVSKSKWEITKYCSIGCSYEAKRGKPSWNKGIKIDREKYPNYGHLKKHTKESLEKITKANKNNAKKHTKEFYRENQKLAIASGREKGNYKGTLGRKKELSSRWKGNRASYNSKHRWVQKNWVKTGICENCKKQTKSFGNRKFGTEWHNLDEKYNREDKRGWIELCKKCHNKFDKL